MATKQSEEELATPLGHVVIQFNYLEIDLGQTISRLVKTDDTVGAIFATLAMNTKLALIRQIASTKLADNAKAAQLKNLLKRVEDLNNKRNAYIHGEYIPVVDPQENYLGMMHRRMKNSLGPFEGIESKVLETLADDVRILAGDLRRFTATMFDLAPD